HKQLIDLAAHVLPITRLADGWAGGHRPSGRARPSTGRTAQAGRDPRPWARVVHHGHPCAHTATAQEHPMRPHLTLPAVVAIVVGVLVVALSVGEGLDLLLAIVLVAPLVVLVVVDELRQSNRAARQRGSAHDQG